MNRMKIKTIFLCTLLVVTTGAMAKDTFTPTERQSISVPTPGLFDRSNAFTIDFESFSSSQWSFPLPVGKSKVLSDNRVEITTRKGDNVKAMFAGTVRLNRFVPGFGNVLVIRHDNGMETVYGNNAQNLVDIGDKVKAGQTIAIVGTEKGRTYCLFAMMVNGGIVNPEMVMNLSSHRLRKQAILCTKNGTSVRMTVQRDISDGNDIGLDAPALTSQDFKNDPFKNGSTYKLDLSGIRPSDWSYPLPGSHVISPYGGRRNHAGVDIKTRPNDDILAAFDGVVTRSSWYSAYGNCIVIRHPNGLETLYGHNVKNLVKVGDPVKAGQKIALTGRTGRATTEHLHFETHINGKRFNPSIIFDHLNHSLQQSTVTFTKRSGGGVGIKSDKNYMAKGQ